MTEDIAATLQAAAPRKGFRWGPGLLWVAAAWLFAMVSLLPWNPSPVDPSVDGSWKWMLHAAFEHHWQFGRDIIFTYGPWGFLVTNTFHPATYALTLAVLAAVVTVWFAAMWKVVRAATVRNWSASLWMAAIILITPMFFDGFGMSLFFALWAFHWIPKNAREDLPGTRGEKLLLHLLVVAAALLSLAKFTWLVMGLLIVLSAATREALKRRFPWVLVTYVVGLLAFWMLAGQPLGNIPVYLRMSVELAAGYGEAMSDTGPAIEMALFGACAALLLVVTWQAQWQARRREALWPTLVFASMLFIVFKGACVRHDFHAFDVGGVVLPWGIALAAQTWAGPWRRARNIPVAACLACVAAFAAVVVCDNYGPSLARRSLVISGSLLPRARGAAEVLSGSRRLEERYRATVEDIAKTLNLPPAHGTVDIYNVNEAIALGCGLNLSPRLEFQSYCAYTRVLAEANVRHLKGPDAPDDVLFMPYTVDGRLPAMDDGLSWPELLTRYDYERTMNCPYGEMLLLKRAATPRTFALEPLGEFKMRTGKPVTLAGVAPGTLLWAVIDLRPTFFGRLWAVAYKPPIVFIHLQTDDGQRHAFRVLPTMMRVGFLLSPVVAETDDFRRLYDLSRATDPAKTVSAIAITGANGASLDGAYRSEFAVKIFRLGIRGATGP